MVRGEAIKNRMSQLSQESQRRDHLLTLRKDTLRKIDFIKSKTVLDGHEVYALIRDFFKEFLEKRYEFTITELQEELKKIYISHATRQHLTAIFEHLHEMEYANVRYRRDQLISILDAFTEVVHDLVQMHARKKSIFSHLRDFFFKEETEPEVIISELPVVEEDTATSVRIHTLVEKCYIALDNHNLHRAKAAYLVLLKEYGAISEREKQQFYPLIRQTYADIVSRANMPH